MFPKTKSSESVVISQRYFPIADGETTPKLRKALKTKH